MTKIPSVALIGVSGYATQHLFALKDLHKRGLVKLSSAVIINPNDVPDAIEYLKSINCKIYSTTKEMYENNKFDLVSIPTGINSHEFLTIEAINNGANVLVEKPAAATVEQVQNMIDIADAKNKFIAIGFQHIYSNKVRELKERVINGLLGNINKVIVVGFAPRMDSYYQRNTWAGKLKDQNQNPVFDSPVNNAVAHFLNLGLFLCAKEMNKNSQFKLDSAELYHARKIESFDTCKFSGSIDNKNIKLYGFFSHTFENSRTSVEVFGDNGNSLSIDLSKKWQLTDSKGNVIEEGEIDLSGIQIFEKVVNKYNNIKDEVCSIQMAKEHSSVVSQLHRNRQIQEVPDDDKVYSDEFLYTPKLMNEFLEEIKSLETKN